MLDNRELFTQKTDDYAKFRPAYPDAAAAWLKAKTTGEFVLDVGAGTGIFTRILSKFFPQVAAVEPNAAMREKFQMFLPHIRCWHSSGEATGLPDDSVDLITVAQAFHWLDADLFKKEAMRILRSAGQVAIVWNTSLQCDFTQERDLVCRKYCPRFRSGHAGKRSVEEGDEFLRNEYFKSVEVVSFSNPFAMDLQTFAGNMRSRSYALAPDDCQYSDFTAELQAVFEKYAVNNIVTEPQETKIYLGKF